MFKNTAKHPHGKHIEEQVCKSSMEEQVGKQLVYSKVGSHKVVEAEHTVQVHPISLKRISGQEHQYIDN